MNKLKENPNCFANPGQRIILGKLFENKIIQENFFLTGGTALSVFYLHHRVSMDLDIFTVNKVQLDDIYTWISKTWPGETVKVNQSEFFLQLLIKNVKVDIVFDPLSFSESREKYFFSKDNFIVIDTIRNIASNKFSTLAGRREIKDFVDFFFLNKLNKNISPEQIYEDASLKEAMFDDPPTLAFQIEQNLEFMRKNPDIFPEILIEFNIDEFYSFYESLITRIYKKVSV